MNVWLITTYNPDMYEEMYLDYVNNFLTVDKFAEYYNIGVTYANHIVTSGRRQLALKQEVANNG